MLACMRHGVGYSKQGDAGKQGKAGDEDEGGDDEDEAGEDDVEEVASGGFMDGLHHEPEGSKVQKILVKVGTVIYCRVKSEFPVSGDWRETSSLSDSSVPRPIPR